MKLYKLISLIFLSGLISCQNKKDEIVIRGKIIGNIPSKVEYSIPVNGFSFAGFRDFVTPDSSGNFQIIIPVTEPTFIEVIIFHQAKGTLLVEPGKEYNVEFNLTLETKKFVVTGKNQIGQNEYNSLPSRHVMAGFKQFLKDTTVAQIEQSVKNKMEKEISQFNEFYKNKEISKDFFELIQLDRKCYYSAIIGTIASYKYVTDYRNNNGVFTLEIERMWTKTFDDTPLILPNISRSLWFYQLSENFIRYNLYTNKSFSPDILLDMSEKGLIQTYMMNESKKYLPSSLLEFYQAAYLYLECIQEKYQKELIQLFEDYKKDFPHSAYTRFLIPVVNPIIEYHKKIEKESNNEKIKFFDKSENINSIKECTELLKGKMIYIDVWATWCGPCHEEFEHQNALKKLLDTKDIVVLYISIDKAEDDKQWKDMIKFYELDGYHIRANKELHSDLLKMYGQNGKLNIPWYILIDGNGKIIKEHASRPSQLNDLEKEINMK